VVGFAMIADLYEADERGRVSGIVMMGTSVAVMVGPTLAAGSTSSAASRCRSSPSPLSP
jgi:MFS family permease